MQRSLLISIIVLSFIHSVWSAQGTRPVRVLDIWSEEPIPNALLISHSDTLQSDGQGLLWLKDHCPRVSKTFVLQAPGYFTEQVSCKALKRGIVYLTPIDQTTFITVVRARGDNMPLNVPSHQTRVLLNREGVPQTIENALAEQSGIFTKSYGPPGQLSSISVRGMTAAQTQILFDGIPLNNLQLGSTDLGQIAGSDLAEADIYRGSNVLFGGNGAIGGSINLRPLRPAERFAFSTHVMYSSLENKSLSTNVHLPLKSIHLRTLLTANVADGLNHYTTSWQGKEVRLRNRDFRHHFFSFQTVFDGLPHQEFKIYLSNYRRSGGASSSFKGEAAELSNRARIHLDNTLSYVRWVRRKAHSEIFAQAYVRNEWMTYDDPTVLSNFVPLHSIPLNREKGLGGLFHYSPRQGLLIKSGVELSEQKINSSEAGKHQRQRYAWYVFSDWALFDRTSALQAFHLSGGWRVEASNSFSSQFLPTIGANFSWQHTQIYASAGRNVRIPGFNDLYWVPGGNPDLRPERALNLEVGFRQNILLGRWLAEAEISAYRNKVSDQIRWLPDYSGIWRPKNLQRIQSTGVELDVQLSHASGRHKLAFNYSFGKSLKEAPDFAGDATVGNQVPFLPQEQWNLRLQSGWSFLRMTFTAQHTGFRYTDFSNDPARILPSFTIFSAGLCGVFKTKLLQFIPEVEIKNLSNQTYQAIPGYPLPGRYVQLGLTIKY